MGIGTLVSSKNNILKILILIYIILLRIQFDWIQVNLAVLMAIRLNFTEFRHMTLNSSKLYGRYFLKTMKMDNSSYYTIRLNEFEFVNNLNGFS